jgi:hypothetical protein
MAAYGKGQMLGSGISPESFKQDYSGFSRAAEIQAQGLQNLGQSIGGAIQNFGEAKKEQKKVDAYNKASAKSIEAAITLGKSYGITAAEETLAPFLQSYNDPNLSPIEKAALLDEGKAMIPNVFGRFDQDQAMNARNTTGGKNVNLQQGEIIETINGKQYKVPVVFDPETGIRTRPDGTVVGTPATASGITSALNLPASQGTGGLQNKSNAIVNALELPTDNLFTNDTSLLPPLNTGVESEVPTLLPFEGSQPNASVPSYAIPVEGGEKQGQIMTTDAVNKLIQQGYKISGTPAENGQIFVTDIQSLAPQQGQEIITNDGTTIRSIALNGQGGLNKAPTTQIKEGEAIVPDATSPTGTRIVQIPSDAKEKAKTDFSGYMQEITGSYATLDAKGKAVTGEKSSIINALTATGAGQAVSRALGSEDQVLRDQINTMRPSIINVIRQATEMGAKGMDSEKELTFYLSAIGDPSLPVEANIKALETLDKVYGTGKAVNEMLKNFPDLKKKVDKYSFKSIPTSETPASGSDNIYEKHGVK